jgi:cytosine/creatinine deaminase
MTGASMTGTNQVLRRCRLRDVDQLRDVYLADGKVAGVDAAHDRSSWGPRDVDVAGRVVLPGLVDAHVHLDKAYLLPQLEDRGAFAGGGVASAIAATKALRDELGLEAFRPGMERLVRSMTAQGIVAARAHVEVDTDIDPAIVGLHREVLAGHPGIQVQLVAFPQNGTSHDPNARSWMERALDDGCTVVGGCPYADPDPSAHLDLVFGLAADRNLPVDLHLDFTDDPAAAQIGLVLPLAERFGLEGRLTLGHMTVLSALPQHQLQETIGGLRDMGVTVIVMPTTDLWLSGRTPKRLGVRGVAPVRALIEGGVRVALASNNHQNAFTPVGGGGLLRVAWLASLVCQIGDSAGQATLLDAITVSPAALLNLGPWSITPGSRAPVLMIDTTEPLDAVREAPAVLRQF